MPPVIPTVAVTISVCPASISVLESERAGTPRAGLTVTRTEEEMVLEPFALVTVPQYRVVTVGEMVKMN